MGEIKVPVDPMNPGQFFACCGLHHLLDSGAGEVFSRFEADENMPRKAQFLLSGTDLNLESLLKKLSEANCVSAGSEGREVEDSIAPVQITAGNDVFRLDWWLNEFSDASIDLKCWAGQVKSSNLFSELTSLIDASTTPDRLLTTSAMTKSKLGIDPRSAWNALDFGFSPNEHNKDAATYPVVEILGSFGLQEFRPNVRRRRAAYAIWLEALPVSIAKLAAYMPWSGLPHVAFNFSIAKRGQSYKYFEFSQYIRKQN